MSETERLRELAWRKSRRGLRWNLLRDVVAICSLKWMNTSEIQDVMMVIHGITRPKTLSLLHELERPEYVIQEKDDKDMSYKWGATPKGVRAWFPMGQQASIPAGLVQVVETTKRVND
ncbi:hypothetical protein ES705_42799 [subsurface metagenome]